MAPPSTRCQNHKVQMETWDMDSIVAHGTYEPRVLGHPRVVTIDGRHAVHFDGASDGMELLRNPLRDMCVFSCTVEIFPERGGLFEQRFLHAGTVHRDRALLELRSQPDGFWYLDVYLSIGDRRLALRDEKIIHPPNRWYTVTLSYDGALLRGFVDGREELCGEPGCSSGAIRCAVSPTVSGDRCSLGMRQNQTSFFKGALSRVVWRNNGATHDDFQG